VLAEDTVVDSDIVEKCAWDLTCGGLVNLVDYTEVKEHHIYKGFIGQYQFKATKKGAQVFSSDSEETSAFRLVDCSGY